MLEDNKKIQVSITVKELRDSLRGMINHPYRNLIVDVILNHLSKSENGYGLEQFYKALQGLAPVSAYKIGDEVLVDVKHLNSYSIDNAKTESAGLFVKGHCLKTEIIAIDLYKKHKLEVQYTYKDSKDQDCQYEYPVHEKEVQPLEDVLPEMKEEEA